MIRKYNARYILLEANGSRSYKDIDITYPEDKSRDTVYREEKESKRVSNIIASLTGYPSNRIELRELKEL